MIGNVTWVNPKFLLLYQINACYSDKRTIIKIDRR